MPSSSLGQYTNMVHLHICKDSDTWIKIFKKKKSMMENRARMHIGILHFKNKRAILWFVRIRTWGHSLSSARHRKTTFRCYHWQVQTYTTDLMKGETQLVSGNQAVRELRKMSVKGKNVSDRKGHLLCSAVTLINNSVWHSWRLRR